MIKPSIVLIGICALSGCSGPLTAPAIRRLDPDQQAQVQSMWNNMLAKPDRLDRDLLLDTLLAFELHQLGVDRATYHAEKDFAGGVVLMDMSFDRLKPLNDWFFVEIQDQQHHVLRKEHYSGDEIWSHYNNLWRGPNSLTTTQPTTAPATRPTEQDLRRQMQEIRWQQIVAATQPMPK